MVCSSTVSPDPVVEITVVNTTTTSVFIAFEFGFNGHGILTEVFVFYETISNAEFDESKLVTFPGSETEPVPSQLEISGLQPFTTYQFGIEVSNEAGNSDTQSISASTLPKRKCFVVDYGTLQGITIDCFFHCV